MTVTLHSTEKVVTLVLGNARIPARIWEGETESGIRCHAYIPRIAVAEGLPASHYAEFERELEEQRKPTAEIDAIPLRLIL
jgi:hypothetical protein